MMVADAHLDLCYDLLRSHRVGERNVLTTRYLPVWREAEVGLIVATIYLDTRSRYEEYYPEALAQLDSLERELAQQDEVILCGSGAEMLRARRHGQIALLLSLEGAEPLGSDLSRLDWFYSHGVRLLGLCWSRENAAGFGAGYEPDGANNSIGLKCFGCDLVRHAGRLGILIDVSHLNDGGCADVARLSERPFFASHSNVRALRKMDRNLGDEAIKAIEAAGGMVGINGYSGLAAATTEEATVSAMADHADYLRRIISADRLGLGLDLMGRLNGGEATFTSGGVSMRGFDILPDQRSVTLLEKELAVRGWSKPEREGFLGENWWSFFSENL